MRERPEGAGRSIVDVPGADRARLHLLGQFSMELDDQHVSIAPAGQRVLAVLALHDGYADRSKVAGTLWPDHTEERALSNLRGAVWRLPAAVRALLDRGRLAFASAVRPVVDLHQAQTTAHDLLVDGSTLRATSVDQQQLAFDLLPDWDEHWLALPRERHRQLRLHALEALARLHLRERRPLHAVDVVLTAVGAEPLRESAQLLLLRAHLAAGNRSSALAQFERFRRQLAAELGVAPSDAMLALVASVRPAQ